MRLETLTPERKDLVIDLVHQSGIDVADWAKYRGGKKRAAANPKYCYEWSFVGRGKVVLNLWRSLMTENRGTFVLAHNTRKGAVKPRAKPAWQRRSAKVDEAIQIAARDGLPIRAIICGGRRRRWSTGGKASEVKTRELDPEHWAVTAYDVDTGDYTLTRRAKPRRLISEVMLFGPRAEDDLDEKIDAEAPLLMRLARAVKKELGSKPGIRYKKQLKAHWTHSGGNRVVIARLRGDRGGTVEVWLDRFADGKVPRFQYGIGAKSERRIKEIEEAAKSAVGYAATRRVDAIDTGTLMKMDPPLDDADFGHPVLECYDTDEAYFGVYHDSPRNTLPAIGPLAKKAAAFLSAVTKAVREHDRDLKSGDGVGEARVATDAEQEEALLAAVAKREGGQRFNLSTKDRKALEDYGMVRAEKWLAREYPRFDAKDVHQRSTCDFECTFGKERFLVEVKCTQTAGKSVFLTRNQVELVKHQGGKMILLVVSGVTLRHVKGKPKVSGGKLLPLKDWQIASKDLVPVTYSYRLPK